MRRMRQSQEGFTLVELLVVIGIIAILVGILLPVLNSAREKANTIKCAANLRSVGQGIAMYCASYKGALPASYYYDGMQIANGVQTPEAAVNGYVHWSSFLYGENAGGSGNGVSGPEAFTCPTIENGGLPPTNTTAGNRDDGQTNDDGEGVVDKQAPRVAFTLNEALCPRNKFVVGFQGAARRYRFVKAGSVRNNGNTILGTEWNQSWRIVADAGRGSGGDTVCKSHRPVHGFVGLGGQLNMDTLAPDAFGGRPTYRRVTLNDLAANPQVGETSGTRLDWVGRNHDHRKLSTVSGRSGVDTRRTNFLYLDGHVETKHIFETIEPFQWGEEFYSLQPSNDVAN